MAPRIPPRIPQTSRSFSLNVQSLPKNYCFSPVVDRSQSYFSPIPTQKFRSRSLEPDFRSARPSDTSWFAEEEEFSDEALSERSLASLHKHSMSKDRRKLFAYRPNFEAIPSVDSDQRDFFPETPPCTEPCNLSKSYFNTSLCKDVLNRSHSLVTDDQIIDVEYDSDIGWKTKSVRRNPYIKRTESTATRDNLKLDLVGRAETSKSETKDTKKDRIRSSGIPKEVGLEKGSDLEKSSDVEKASSTASRRNNFTKVRSRSSATSNDSDIPQDISEVVNEVVDTFKDLFKDTAKVKSMSASSESLLVKKRGTFVASKARTSSVSIKEHPEYIDHDNLNNLSNPSHAIANSPQKSSPDINEKRKKSANSDYDRDRGRSRHLEGGHRESFKKNERTNDRNSDQDRDASDRELKDGSLNRSLSNTDTNIEDRIGKDESFKFSRHG